MGLDNANPIILSASELPSHRQRRTKKKASSKQYVVRDLLTGPSYASDPFMAESDTDSDDSNVEPIDEQEIYG
jgi:hypothetical protein